MGLLSDAAEMYRDLVGLLARLGRVGGLLVLALAGGSAWGACWVLVSLGPWNGAPVWSPLGLVAGLGLGLLSLTAFFEGVRLVLKGAPSRPAKLEAGEFLALIKRAPKPCLVCIDCRLLLPAAPCPGCGASSTCVDVSDESDFKLVRAAVSPEPERE